MDFQLLQFFFYLILRVIAREGVDQNWSAIHLLGSMYLTGSVLVISTHIKILW